MLSQAFDDASRWLTGQIPQTRAVMVRALLPNPQRPLMRCLGRHKLCSSLQI